MDDKSLEATLFYILTYILLVDSCMSVGHLSSLLNMNNAPTCRMPNISARMVPILQQFCTEHIATA